MLFTCFFPFVVLLYMCIFIHPSHICLESFHFIPNVEFTRGIKLFKYNNIHSRSYQTFWECSARHLQALNGNFWGIQCFSHTLVNLRFYYIKNTYLESMLLMVVWPKAWVSPSEIRTDTITPGHYQDSLLRSWPLCGYGIRHASSLFYQTFRKITRLLLFSKDPP